MTTTGSPKGSSTVVSTVPFILGSEQAIRLSPLTAHECFTVLRSAVARVQPNLRQVFKHTFQEVFENTWEDVGPMPDLPPGLDARTKCVCIAVTIPLFLGEPRHVHRKERFVIVTRNGGIFLWYCDMTKEHPSHRVVPLSEEVFVQEWRREHARNLERVIGFVLQDLDAQFKRVLWDIEQRVDPLRSSERWLKRTRDRLYSHTL